MLQRCRQPRQLIRRMVTVWSLQWRESHHGQRDIRHIIEEAAQETIAYLPLDEGHRQHTDDVGRDDGQQDANDDITLLHRLRF